MKERITWGWLDPHSRVLRSSINTSHPHWRWIWYHHHVFLLLFFSPTYLWTCIIIHSFIFFHNPPAPNPVHTYHTHTHTQQSIISFGWWKENLSGVRLLSPQVRVVPVYVIVRMDWSTLLCPVPSYQYFPPPLSLDMISSSCLVVTLVSPVYHHTCIIIHPSICITTLNLQTHSTHTTPHTHPTMNYIFWVMTSSSLIPQVVISAGEYGPHGCDCEDGFILTPLCCAIISLPPIHLALDTIPSSCFLVTLPQPHESSYMHCHHPSNHLRSNRADTNPVHTPITQTH